MNIEEIARILEGRDKISVLLENIEPRGAPRPRANAKMIHGKMKIWQNMPEWYPLYKENMFIALKDYLFRAGLNMPQPDRPFAINCEFGFKYPKNHPKFSAEDESLLEAKDDVDNLLKGVKDMLQQNGLIVNDSQISIEFGVKVRTTGESYILFTLYSLPEADQLDGIPETILKRFWNYICKHYRDRSKSLRANIST